MRWAALTGLEAEARILRRQGLAAEPCGADPVRAAAIAARLIDGGADALLSFGIAGALAPGLAPGALLLPRCVVTESGARYVVDAARHAALAKTLAANARVDERDLLGRDRVAMTVDDKAALFRASGAAAIDLESHIVAAAALGAGRPFVVLRAIADPADCALPPAVLVGLDRAGRAAPWPVLRALLKEPAQLPALVRLAFATRAALATLSRAASALLGSS
jgi:hopanoid-associated phosphorylase